MGKVIITVIIEIIMINKIVGIEKVKKKDKVNVIF